MATNVKVEVVKVTHEQLNKRVENSNKAADHDERKGKTDSWFGAEKEEKHPTKSRPSKARKEKEQRKPDQQLYRPGRSRMVRNSSSGGSDLNSSRDQSPSPTKPVQTPAISREVGSKGDQGSPVQEASLSKELPQHEEAEQGAVRSKNRGHDERSVADKPQRGGVSGGGRHGRMDRRDASGNNHAKSGSRPRDKQQPWHQREQQNRPVRQDLSKMPYSGKTCPVDNEHGHEDTWEIKPEDWETDTKSPADRGNEAINPPKQMHGRNSRDSHPKHTQDWTRNESPTKPMQGRGNNESPPKQMHGQSTNERPPNQMHGRSTNESPPKQMHGRSTNESPPKQMQGRSTNESPQKQMHGQSTNERPPNQMHGRSTNESPPKQMHGRSTNESPPKQMQGRSTDESPPKQMQGRRTNESLPKQMQGRNGKGKHDADIGNKDRKQKVTDESKVSENRPQEVVSLMGNDWDKEFEQQYEAEHSPEAKKSTYLHRKDSTKQTETGERLPRSRSNQTSGPSNRRQDHGARTSDKQCHSKTEPDSSGKEPKKDLVKSSRQNYASEIQKLRAKKEQMEREEFEMVPGTSTKDLQITVKAGSQTDESSRVVQEKSSKSYSAGRSRQRTNSENASKNDKTVMDHHLTMSGEWEENVDDLNFRVESMVITNQKFQNKDFEESGRFEKRYDERRRAPNRDERSQNKDRDDRGLERQRDEWKRPPNKDEKFQNRDHDDRSFERQRDVRKRPPNRDEKFQNRDHDDTSFERQGDERKRPPNRDEKFQNKDHDDRSFERQGDERKRPPNRDEKEAVHRDHAPRQPHASSSQYEQKDHRNERLYRDKEEPHAPGNERRFRDKEQSHRQENERGYQVPEEPRRTRNEGHDDKRSVPDERFKEERHQHGIEPDRHQREQDPRRRYHSGGRKEVTRRRDRVSVSSDDGSERQGRRRGSSEAEESSTKHGGGILRLPGKVEQENSQALHGSYIPVYDQYYQPPAGQADAPVIPEEPKAKPKGRTGDQSRLWDPSKPHQKPALQQHQLKHGELHFQDPELDKRDSRGGGTPPAAQPENWNSYIPNYPPGFGGVMQPPYGYPPPPPGYPAPNPSSWANQVEAAQAYKSGHPPLPPPHMMQYPPPYAGHPYPLPPGMPYHPGFGNPPHAAMLQEHQSVNSQSAQKLLRDAARCETELFNALSLGIATRDMLQQLLDKEQELEQLYEGIILLDLDLCNQHNVEQTLWKNSYYQLIEGLRKAIQEQPNGESYKEDLLEFMQHGTAFYEGLLNKLQSTYHFQLENRTGLDPLHEEPRRSIKLALLSAQRCMIALGDIARYKEQANETSNYGKARSWYMKAQHLAPRNGRPYNQLAILALYTRRKLDAVYFYVRSLAATNPFLTARESLMTLFEEVRRKVAHKEQEEMEARREMEKRREQRKRRRRRPSRDENRGRTEVWVAQDGRRVGGEKMEDEEEEEEDEMQKENLTNLSATELNKKFVLSFLNVHGKLFTKTGMEAYEHATEHLLREFKALLDHSPSAILSTRLIQLMAINMFAVANASPPGESPSTAETRPLLLEQSIQLGLHMFALLCLRCCALLQVHLNQKDTDQSVLSQDLHELLPGVKVYADWMMCHPKLWNPPPSYSSTSYSASLDVWSAVAQFLNLVKRVAVPDVKFAVNDEEDSLEVLLPEDMTLSGFLPLMALPLQPVFIQADTSKILANDRVRLDSLTMFGEYLSGQETPLISFSVKTDSYISIAPKTVPRGETEHSYLQDEYLEREDDDVIVMDSYIDDEVSPGDGTISRLRERRDSLEKQLRDREVRDAHIQAIVESHRSQRLLEIVIKPYFLIPDTNCFIDHLTAIQRLVMCQRYLMVIPLVVINELDGLARGSREGQFSDPHHAIKVQQGARHAVDYLEEEFANRNRYLCALTSKGSTMDNIRFRSEEAEWRGNNDDHILRCCMHYCSDNARQYMPRDKDAPLQIEREVVLLTNDRNLRVKAIQQNVPVKDIIVFVRWAKV